MHRRFWIKEIVFATGAVMLMPYCMNNNGQVSISLKHMRISADDEKLMATVVDAIIPAAAEAVTGGPGLHHFVLKMIDDCYPQDDRDRFGKALKHFNAFAKEKTGQEFTSAGVAEKIALFHNIDRDEKGLPEQHFFIRTTRQLSVLGYTQSKFFMTRIIPYELVPGRFHGCVPVKPV